MIFYLILILKKLNIALVCLASSLFFLSFFILVYSFLDLNYSSYQFILIINYFLYNEKNIGLCLGFGLDGLSLVFLILNNLLFSLIFLTCWKLDFNFKTEYCYCLISLNLFLNLVFSTLDILTFFFMFESVLIPMFLIIGL